MAPDSHPANIRICDTRKYVQPANSVEDFMHDKKNSARQPTLMHEKKKKKKKSIWWPVTALAVQKFLHGISISLYVETVREDVGLL